MYTNSSSIQEGKMSERDIEAIFAKLDSINNRTARTELSVEVIKTKLGVIDSRGSQKSTDAIAEVNAKIADVDAKINRAAGAVAVLSLLFSYALAKLGLK